MLFKVFVVIDIHPKCVYGSSDQFSINM